MERIVNDGFHPECLRLQPSFEDARIIMKADRVPRLRLDTLLNDSNDEEEVVDKILALARAEDPESQVFTLSYDEHVDAKNDLLSRELHFSDWTSTRDKEHVGMKLLDRQLTELPEIVVGQRCPHVSIAFPKLFEDWSGVFLPPQVNGFPKNRIISYPSLESLSSNQQVPYISSGEEDDVHTTQSNRSSDSAPLAKTDALHQLPSRQTTIGEVEPRQTLTFAEEQFLSTEKGDTNGLQVFIKTSSTLNACQGQTKEDPGAFSDHNQLTAHLRRECSDTVQVSCSNYDEQEDELLQHTLCLTTSGENSVKIGNSFVGNELDAQKSNLMPDERSNTTENGFIGNDILSQSEEVFMITIAGTDVRFNGDPSDQPHAGFQPAEDARIACGNIEPSVSVDVVSIENDDGARNSSSIIKAETSPKIHSLSQHDDISICTLIPDVIHEVSADDISVTGLPDNIHPAGNGAPITAAKSSDSTAAPPTVGSRLDYTDEYGSVDAGVTENNINTVAVCYASNDSSAILEHMTNVCFTSTNMLDPGYVVLGGAEESVSRTMESRYKNEIVNDGSIQHSVHSVATKSECPTEMETVPNLLKSGFRGGDHVFDETASFFYNEDLPSNSLCATEKEQRRTSELPSQVLGDNAGLPGGKPFEQMPSRRCVDEVDLASSPNTKLSPVSSAHTLDVDSSDHHHQSTQEAAFLLGTDILSRDPALENIISTERDACQQLLERQATLAVPDETNLRDNSISFVSENQPEIPQTNYKEISFTSDRDDDPELLTSFERNESLEDPSACNSKTSQVLATSSLNEGAPSSADPTLRQPSLMRSNETSTRQVSTSRLPTPSERSKTPEFLRVQLRKTGRLLSQPQEKIDKDDSYVIPPDGSIKPALARSIFEARARAQAERAAAASTVQFYGGQRLLLVEIKKPAAKAVPSDKWFLQHVRWT